MSKWDVKIITSMPEFFPGIFNYSLIGKALKKNIWSLETYDLKEYSSNKFNKIDDTPYGGGPGMVIRPDVVDRALKKAIENMENKLPLIYMTPAGKNLTQKKLEQLSEGPGLIILCGRFEGIDERVLDAYDFERISVGDYILAGGETAATSLIEGCIRLIPGVIGKKESLIDESFSNGLLEYPHYTKPKTWLDSRNNKEYEVPEILLSGNHKEINEWRKRKSIKKTRKYRPELLSK